MVTKALTCLIKKKKGGMEGGRMLIGLYCFENKHTECLIQTTFWYGWALHGVLSGSSPSSVRPSVHVMCLKSLVVWTPLNSATTEETTQGQVEAQLVYSPDGGMSSELLKKLCFKNICCWLASGDDFLFVNHHWAAQRSSLLHIIL